HVAKREGLMRGGLEQVVGHWGEGNAGSIALILADADSHFPADLGGLHGHPVHAVEDLLGGHDVPELGLPKHSLDDAPLPRPLADLLVRKLLQEARPGPIALRASLAVDVLR